MNIKRAQRKLANVIQTTKGKRFIILSVILFYVAMMVISGLLYVWSFARFWDEIHREVETEEEVTMDTSENEDQFIPL